ncbi:MAG: Asp-tRNA(Asn)/Glu-tRNA(Gln) amidotransferase subunit GatC [Minisyncoccia bacterium]
MTITKEEIKNLADLARIEVTDEEISSMTGEIDSILGYVSAVQKFSGDSKLEVPELRNVMREDEITNATDEYKIKLLANAPQQDGNYIKVKKIL